MAKSESIRVRLDSEDYAEFNRFCEKYKFSQSNAIRLAVQQLIKRFRDEEIAEQNRLFYEKEQDEWGWINAKDSH